MQGPLRGLKLAERSAEGCHIPRLLGCYEQPLHPYIEAAINTPYDVIINIGCAEGYYAVGMARRMPNTRVYAYDQNPNARSACARLAIENEVQDRVEIGEHFTKNDFMQYTKQKVLVMCDIEGAELDLINLDEAPELEGMDLIIESHECLVPGITSTLKKRFVNTHTVTEVPSTPHRNITGAPNWMKNLSDLDQLLAAWEWRAGPTPWLVMVSKTR